MRVWHGNASDRTQYRLMEVSMALIEDVFKGNLATGLAIGVGAIILGPTVIQTVGSILQPAAKTLIKGAMVFYREILSELGDMVADPVDESRAELNQDVLLVAQVLHPTS